MIDYDFWMLIGTWFSGIFIALTVGVTLWHISSQNERRIELIIDWKVYDDEVCFQIRNDGKEALRVDTIGIYIAGQDIFINKRDLDIKARSTSMNVYFENNSMKGVTEPYGVADTHRAVTITIRRETFENFIQTIIDKETSSRRKLKVIRFLIKGNGMKFYSRWLLDRWVCSRAGHMFKEERREEKMQRWRFEPSRFNTDIIIMAGMIGFFLALAINKLNESYAGDGVLLWLVLLTLATAFFLCYRSLRGTWGKVRNLAAGITCSFLAVGCICIAMLAHPNEESIYTPVIVFLIMFPMFSFFGYREFSILSGNEMPPGLVEGADEIIDSEEQEI
jgi:hypothetical protein